MTLRLLLMTSEKEAPKFDADDCCYLLLVVASAVYHWEKGGTGVSKEEPLEGGTSRWKVREAC